jgi:hypothetical protein
MILSPPRQTFRQTYTTRIAMAVFFLGAALVVWMIQSEAGVDAIWPYLAEGALVALTVVFWIMIGKTQLTIHDEGVRYTNVFGSKELEWHQVREYRYRVVPVSGYHGGGLIGVIIIAAMRRAGNKAGTTNLYLTLVGDTGTKIAVTSFLKGAYDAVGLILGQLHERMRQRVESEVRSTGAMFGPLRLSAREMQWKQKEPVALTELTKAEITGQNLQIRRKGKMLSLVTIRSDKVPNVLLLLETMEKLGVGASAVPTVDPLARVRI